LKNNILETLIKKKTDLHKEINSTFITGLKEACQDYPEVQGIILYKVIIDYDAFESGSDQDITYSYSLAFRPKKEYKQLLELAEQFRTDKNLEHACIPLQDLHPSDCSTTKFYSKTKDVITLIRSYKKLAEYIEYIFEELSDDLEVNLSLQNSMNANFYKLT